MNNKYLLEITNLCKNYTNENNSKIEIIKNLNFKLKQNTKVSIVGPSGSGKTTFLNIIGLLDSEYDGNFYFKNKDISLCSKDETNKIRGLSIGFIHQFFHLIPELTVIENVMLPFLINKTDLIIGYSDHTIGSTGCLGAVALGAKLIEKHFTIDKKFSNFRDHSISADYEELKNIVMNIRKMENQLGTLKKTILKPEKILLK